MLVSVGDGSGSMDGVGVSVGEVGSLGVVLTGVVGVVGGVLTGVVGGVLTGVVGVVGEPEPPDPRLGRLLLPPCDDCFDAPIAAGTPPGRAAFMPGSSGADCRMPRDPPCFRPGDCTCGAGR